MERTEPSPLLNPAASYGEKLRSPEFAILILLIFYIVGIVGILRPLHPQFILLTPLNLLLSLALVLWHHPRWNRETLIFLALTYGVGFGAELFGVQTGLLFGEYHYGDVLGPKLWDTPLMIGINWMLLAYCAGVTVNHLMEDQHWILKGLTGSALMVGLDLFIEPVAMHYEFWSWPDDIVPVKNYIGWFIVSLPLLLVFAKLLPETKNKVAVALFILQFLFFLTLDLKE